MSAIFGPAGNSDSFKVMGYKSNTDAPEYVSKMELDLYEYQCGRGVRVSEENAKVYRENAKKETCYIRYRGFFIPQFDQDAPSFRKSYKDRFCYRKYCPEEITEEFCELIGETVLSYLNA